MSDFVDRNWVALPVDLAASVAAVADIGIEIVIVAVVAAGCMEDTAAVELAIARTGFSLDRPWDCSLLTLAQLNPVRMQDAAAVAGW